MASRINIEYHSKIGARLKVLRKARGKSLEYVGGLIGRTFQQIQKYEKGTNRIPNDYLAVIAADFGVSPADIIGNGHASSEEDNEFFADVAVLSRTRVGAELLVELVRLAAAREHEHLAALLAVAELMAVPEERK